MGYMGFGMKKEVYTRKAKKPYAYLKSLYGEQLEMHFSKGYLTTVEDQRLSESDWDKFRKKVQKRVRQENIQRIKAAIISVVITIAVLFALVWLVGEWFGI